MARAAAATARTAAAPARRARPAAPRGKAAAPARRAAPRGKAAAPARRHARRAAQPRRAIRVVPRGGARPAAAAIGSGVLDRLLRGRAWIACIGALLAGVVFLNVSLLEINRGITQKVERSAELKRDNAQLRLRVAELASSERIQETAAARGFVLPAPGDVRYLKTGRGDAGQAAERMTAPSGAPAPAPEPQGLEQAPETAAPTGPGTTTTPGGPAPGTTAAPGEPAPGTMAAPGEPAPGATAAPAQPPAAPQSAPTGAEQAPPAGAH